MKDVPPETIQLATEGSRAWGTMILQLKRGSQYGLARSYQVRYYNERRQRSQQPIVHQIEVIRDLLAGSAAPAAAANARRSAAKTASRRSKCGQFDPDFGLSQVRIEGTACRQTHGSR